MKKKFSSAQSTSKPFDGHEFKKSLGQNFIKDTNLLKSIVRDAGVGEEDYVLEIGAGAGTLTRELADSAHAVLSMEVDLSLKENLRALESEKENLAIWFSDGLKTENEDILNKFNEIFGSKPKEIKVVANIPYYITTPLIFKFLKFEEVSSITIMVQKEVAERIVSKSSTGEYGALSIMVNYYGVPSIARKVDKTMFYPVPKVDSAVLKIEKNRLRDKSIEQVLTEVVRRSFAMRRKTLVNNLDGLKGLSKTEILNLLQEMGKLPTVRAEELNIEDYLTLSKKIERIR